MSAVAAIFAWLGLAAGAAVLLLVVVLLGRVLRPLREAKRYAEDTLAAGLGITENLDAVDEAARTRELVTAVPPLALRFLERS